MALMAQPWKHPATGAYYLRRQVPAALRCAFGNKSLYKVSLRTKNFAKAAQLFVEANAALEREFEIARERLAASGDPRPSQQDYRDRLIAAYFRSSGADGGLEGPERLTLAFLEGDRLLHRAMGQADGMFDPPSSKERWLAMATNAAVFRSEQDRLKKTASARPGKLWKMVASDGGYAKSRALHAERIIEQMCQLSELSADLPDGLGEAIITYLDEAPLEHQLRKRKPRHAVTRLRPGMRLRELFEQWSTETRPTAKCSHEYKRSVEDFIDYTGDIAVAEIVRDDLLNWRDEVAKMPKAMGRADRALAFTARMAAHGDSSGPKVSPTTVKKRVGAIQALLTFAHEQQWISRNEGIRTPILGYSKNAGTARRIFLDGELAALFATDLFTRAEQWRLKSSAVSDCTLFWLFVIGVTSGARLEEIGQAALSDVKLDGDILFIDIDDYVVDAQAAPKQVKNPNSRRIVPLHDHVIRLGFPEYVAALRAAGHRELFPDLRRNTLGTRTQAASQRANRYIDRHLTKDGRLVFHSFRHTFKNKGTTARIDSRILDQLCGHTPTTVGGKYGEGQPLWVLHEELHKLDFSCIDWGRMMITDSGIDWLVVVACLQPAASNPRDQNR